MTSVHDAILEDLCFPSEIVGKRIHVKMDGTKTIKAWVYNLFRTSLLRDNFVKLMQIIYEYHPACVKYFLSVMKVLSPQSDISWLIDFFWDN